MIVNKKKKIFLIAFIMLIFLYPSIFLHAQDTNRASYKDYKRVKIPIVKDKKKRTWYIGKRKGDKVQLNFLVRELETLDIFLNDSFCLRDSITRLDWTDYDLYSLINIPKDKKKHYIYIYFENNKKYIRLPHKRKYYFISLYFPLEKGSNKAIYDNNAPL